MLGDAACVTAEFVAGAFGPLLGGGWGHPEEAGQDRRLGSLSVVDERATAPRPRVQASLAEADDARGMTGRLPSLDAGEQPETGDVAQGGPWVVSRVAQFDGQAGERFGQDDPLTIEPDAGPATLAELYGIDGEGEQAAEGLPVEQDERTRDTIGQLQGVVVQEAAQQYPTFLRADQRFGVVAACPVHDQVPQRCQL